MKLQAYACRKRKFQCAKKITVKILTRAFDVRSGKELNWELTSYPSKLKMPLMTMQMIIKDSYMVQTVQQRIKGAECTVRKLGKVRIWNVHSSSWQLSCEWCLEFKGLILIDNIMDTISQYHGLTSFALIFFYFHKLLQIQTHHRQLHNERTVLKATSHRSPKLKTKRDLACFSPCSSPSPFCACHAG